MTLSPVVIRSLLVLVGAALLVVLGLATGLLGTGDADPSAGGSLPADTAVASHSAAVSVPDETSFISGMIPHHQEAVDSATALLTLTRRPEVRAAAEEIVRVQSDEIAKLGAWLAEWYQDASPAEPYEPMMRALAGLSPEEADSTFVADMIVHHEMAMAMAEAYLALPGPHRTEVQSLADEIVATQGEEIERMRSWLEAWGVAEHGEGY